MNTNFNISQNDYVAFDAMSLRQLIIDRLNEQGIFTDQNYIGSNLASIIDIVSYAYNTLIFYLNKTSTESMFTEAQIYENINRIVKMIDYKPVGVQTSTLIVDCSAVNLPPNQYTVPRYSSITKNNISFSFNEDITFSKITPVNILQNLSEISQQKPLYQGRYQEYPLYTALGEENEILLLDTANSLVDHFNIDVYVKSIQTGIWKHYSKTPNLYLENGYSEKYEIRLNSNKRYEIKFGNNINGKKLSQGDQIAVYYLVSNGSNGVVSSNTFNAFAGLTKLNSPQLAIILNDLYRDNDARFLNDEEIVNLYFNSTVPSSFFQNAETAEEIRQNAPNTYKQQYRLVTVNDYETFTKTNFANLIADVKAFNNWNYTTEYLKYFYDIGLTNATITDRALFNQVQFADSCNFNNVYLTIVPKTNSSNSLNYLLPAQKELIETDIQALKMLTTEVSFVDPVYRAVSFGVKPPDNSSTSTNNFIEGDIAQPSISTNNFIEDDTAQLVVYKLPQQSDEYIKNSIVNIFYNYFSSSYMRLGQTLSLKDLSQAILSIEGVQYFKTIQYNYNEDISIYNDGLSFQIWNPLYPNNDRVFTQNDTPGLFFQYFYFYDIENLYNKITVENIVNPNQKIGY